MAQRIGTYRLGNIIIFHSVKYFTNLFVQYFTIYRAPYPWRYLTNRNRHQNATPATPIDFNPCRLHLTV